MFRKNKKDDLDTETTIVDMNVEGFKWYDPYLKNKSQKGKKEKISRKEYWTMVGAAYKAILPVILIICLAAAIVMTIAYFWLN